MDAFPFSRSLLESEFQIVRLKVLFEQTKTVAFSFTLASFRPIFNLNSKSHKQTFASLELGPLERENKENILGENKPFWLYKMQA